jgi:predicted nuclease of restriction endonuclease-like RecB superfamily
MLTADLVNVRRRGDRLSVVPLGEVDRERALSLAEAYLSLAHGHLGQPRGALLEAYRAVEVAPREQKLARGLAKLVLDRCQFEEQTTLDPPALRRELFLAAAGARQRDERGELDRAGLIAVVAEARSASAEEVEAALYADLPDAHRLQSLDAVSARSLVDGYDLAQAQAVLLKAVKVTAAVRAAPGSYRQLFRRLKFLRLLHRIHRLPDGRGGIPSGYTVEIDGPFALFESVTKYGLQLALALPAIAACDEWALTAELRWGREATPLRLELRGGGGGPIGDEALPDEVATLLEDLRAAGSEWRAAPSAAVLDLPGVGLCVPDLELTRGGQTVYLEVLGFWSREAVWKRVELVERGLPHPMVFAVSKHLRVSEQALGDEHPAALYVYSRKMNASAVLARAEAAAAPRPAPAR